MTRLLRRGVVLRSAIFVVLLGTFASGWLAFRENANDAAVGQRPIGGPFELTSHRGDVVSNVTLRGKPYVAFFGFTNCPEICPTTLFELTDLMKELGSDADAFNVFLITVDPERDTRELLSLYLQAFDKRIVALRGNTAQMDKVLAAFRAVATKVDTGNATYTIDHTAGVYLMDAQGRFKGMLDMHEPREVRIRKLRNLAANGA